MSQPSSPFPSPSRHHSGINKDEDVKMRLEYFAPARNRIRNTSAMLNWSRHGAAVWHWPRYSDGTLYPAHELPTAFTILTLPHPQCPCASQETELNISHDYVIWVVQTGIYQGKVAARCAASRQGCNSWINLTDLLERTPNIPSREYPMRPRGTRGPGLPDFDPFNLIIRPEEGPSNTTSSPTPMSSPPTVLQTPRSPPPSVRRMPVSPPPRFFRTPTTNRRFGRGGTSVNTSHQVQNSQGDPFALSETAAPSPDPLRYTPSRPPPQTPLPQTPPPQIPPVVDFTAISDSFNKFIDENGLNDVDPKHNNGTLMPGERYFGDTACLWIPPDPSVVLTKNRHISPLYGVEAEMALHKLHGITGGGLTWDQFWSLYDQCNCGLFFNKAILHNFHGPICPLWPYRDTPQAPQSYVVYDPDRATPQY